MTDQLRKAAEVALRRLDFYYVQHGNDDDFTALIALRQALAQGEQKSAEQFWQGVYPDGWTAERVKNEMSDYHMILDGLSGLFDYITGGACSKENTDKAVIKMLFDQHIEKLVEERVKEEIEALGQDHGFDRTASHMAGEYADTAWDTSDMAHRTGGLTVEQSIASDMGIDRGAWSDVPDATKWVDELRGDEEPEQEPVAWWTGKEKSEDEDFMYPKTRQAHIQHPNSATANFYPVPLYTAPPSKPWVSLTDEEVEDIASKSVFYINVAKAVEAKLKEKNNG